MCLYKYFFTHKRKIDVGWHPRQFSVLIIFSLLSESVNFEAETSIIKVQTFYQNLGFQSEGDEDAECEARLDTKKLQKAINSLLSLVNYERIILCMVQDCALVFHTRLPFDLGEFTIYLGLNIGEE